MRDLTSPLGLFGFANARQKKVTLHRANIERENIDCNTDYDCKVWVWKERYIQSGGWFGTPFEGMVERVQQDVQYVLVSIQRATQVCVMTEERNMLNRDNAVYESTLTGRCVPWCLIEPMGSSATWTDCLIAPFLAKAISFRKVLLSWTVYPPVVNFFF